jgi:hypothetical protein
MYHMTAKGRDGSRGTRFGILDSDGSHVKKEEGKREVGIRYCISLRLSLFGSLTWSLIASDEIGIGSGP